MPRRALNDTVWVRERYCYAGREEPTGDEILWWFSAEGCVEQEAEVKGGLGMQGSRPYNGSAQLGYCVNWGKRSGGENIMGYGGLDNSVRRNQEYQG